MNTEAYTVAVEKGLEDLIPEFLKNRHREVATLQAAVAAADFEQLRQAGHRMRGVGTPYGFDRISELGKQIEDSAKAGNGAEVETALAQYADYLSRLKIVYA